MTPWLRLPSAFRTLRAAVLPPVLITTATYGVYGIWAYGSATEQGFWPAERIQPVSYAVRCGHDGRLGSGVRITAVVRRPSITQLAYRDRPGIAPLITPPPVPKHVPFTAPTTSDPLDMSATSYRQTVAGHAFAPLRTATAQLTASDPPAGVFAASVSPSASSAAFAPSAGASTAAASPAGPSAPEETGSATRTDDAVVPGHSPSWIPTHASAPTHTSSAAAHTSSATPTRTHDDDGDENRTQGRPPGRDAPADHHKPPGRGKPDDHDKPHGHARHHGHAHPPDPSRAGSWAGEGRIRPGRPGHEPVDDEPAYTDQDSPAPPQRTPKPADPSTQGPGTGIAPSTDAADLLAASPAPSQGAAGSAREASASQPVVEILPLGSGLVLVGLGLALALLALRLRRE